MTAQLHRATLAHLRLLTTMPTHNGDVPGAPRADGAGRVYPYAVLWPSPGADALEQSVTRETGTEWWCSITVAAGDVDWLMDAVDLVRAHVDGFLVAPGATLVDVTPAARTIQRDPDVKPARWYVPLAFRTLTP